MINTTPTTTTEAGMTTAQLAELIATAIDRDVDGATADGELHEGDYTTGFGVETGDKLFKITVTEVPF